MISRAVLTSSEEKSGRMRVFPWTFLREARTDLTRGLSSHKLLLSVLTLSDPDISIFTSVLDSRAWRMLSVWCWDSRWATMVNNWDWICRDRVCSFYVLTDLKERRNRFKFQN